MKVGSLCPALLALTLTTVGAARTQVKAEPYNWKSVQMVGGGFVDGIVFHPTAKGVCYARTDIGGAYRWNPKTHRWDPLLDWVPLKDVNLMGVESIGLDARDANRLYLACGMYTNASSPDAAILRSDDRGKTFQRTNLPFKMGGNENGRGNGERLSVDPSDGRILLFGSRHNGLWRSDDRAVTWRQVSTFPAIPAASGFGFRAGAGIVCTLFDPAGSVTGRPTKTVYAAVSQTGEPNLLVSHDGGDSWAPIPGEPTTVMPTRMKLASDGTLYIAYGSSPGPSGMNNGAIWKLDTRSGTWTDITPDKPVPGTRNFGYAAVSVDSKNPRALIVSTFYHPDGEEIFRSLDAGQTWKPIFHAGGGTYDFKLAPYVARTPIHWLFDIEIDPANSDHALFTTGYGGYETFDLTNVDKGKPTKWSVMSTGIEETVVLQLLSPVAGPHLLTAIGDYGGFVHWNLDQPSPDGNYDHPHFGNTTSVAYAADAPNVFVRVGRQSGNRGGGNIGYSTDGAHTWQTTVALPRPGANSGTIAVSADGTHWVWSLPRGPSYVTADMGKSWQEITALPNGLRVLADPNDAYRFYALDLFENRLYTGDRSALNWTSVDLNLPGGPIAQGRDRGDGRGGQDQLYPTPGIPGDLWVAAYDGLFHSTSPAGGYVRMPGVEQLWAFGFGRGAPHTRFPALYLVGTVAGVRGVFRSDDFAKTWIRINDDAHQWGLILQVSGDPRIYGRVYVGTHGRGALYGDPKR